MEKVENYIDLSKIKVCLTKKQIKAYKKMLEYHIKHDLPLICAMFGHNVYQDKKYQELLSEYDDPEYMKFAEEMKNMNIKSRS